MTEIWSLTKPRTVPRVNILFQVASENGEPRDRLEVDPAKMTRKLHLR